MVQKRKGRKVQDPAPSKRKEPAASRPTVPGYEFSANKAGLLPWKWAADRLHKSRQYWIATTRRDWRVTRCNSVKTWTRRNGKRKAPPCEHEAGLVITSDFCPARPGSYTRRSASLESSIFVCLRLGQSVISFARARRPNRAPRPSAGAELTLGWRHGSSARVDRRDDLDSGRSVRCRDLGTRKHSTHHGDERH